VLSKILALKNVGLFENQGNQDLGKFTIIYGENGRGKSTLCAMLRSLKTGDPEPIMERRTLGSGEDTSLSFMVGKKQARFSGGKWTRLLPELLVFDAHFVDHNVYSGNAVDVEHTRNLCQFVIGESNVELAKKIDSIDEEIRSINTELRTLEKLIKSHVLKPMSLEEFLALDPCHEIDQAIQAKEREVQNIKNISALLGQPLPFRVSLPVIDWDGIQTTLTRTLGDIAKNAEEVTKRHIAECLGDAGEAWIRQGMDYPAGDKCPFCGQALHGSELIAAYQSYFDESYRTFKKEITDLKGDVTKQLSETALLAIQKQLSTNQTQIQFWRDHVAGSIDPIEFDCARDVIVALRKALKRVLERKVAAPLEEVRFGKECSDAVDAYNALAQQVDQYNEQIDAFGMSITTFRENLAQGDLAKVQTELDTLRNQQKRFTASVNEVCQKYMDLRNEKSSLQKEKAALQEQLREASCQEFSMYQDCINSYLKRFGAGFSLENADLSYRGGKARAGYELVVRGCSVPLKKPKTSGTAYFGNTLSEGDKSTLAFAFFMSSLDTVSDLQDRVVVFDDPFSSLDRHRRNQTRKEIGRIAKRAQQTIVMTHDLIFAHRLWKDRYLRDLPKTSIQILRQETGSVLTNFDISRAARSNYFNHYEALSKYLKFGPDPSTTLGNVAAAMREVLEGNLKIRFPEEYPETSDLGGFLYKIQKADEQTSLSCLKKHLDKLSEINEYTIPYHHTEPREIEEPLTDAELKTYVEFTLKFCTGADFDN